MAAAVPVLASAHAAALAAPVVQAVNAMDPMDRKQHNMAWMAVPALSVVLLKQWVQSTCSSLPSR